MNIRMNGGLLIPAILLLVVSGCTLNRHTIPPYNKDAEASKNLQKHAAEVCLTRKRELPPEQMFTDGCSAWPDGKKRECCVTHDIEYWCGGTKRDRKKADTEFKSCVSRETGPINASLVYRGVRMGGVPWLPFRWRWGYGYKYLKKHRYEKRDQKGE